jgi:Bacterial Ig domain
MSPSGAEVERNIQHKIAQAANNARLIPVGKGPVYIGVPAHGLPPVAVNETTTTPSSTPVTIDLSVGATGNPTSTAIVTGPTNVTLGAITGTTVTYTPNTGFVGTDIKPKARLSPLATCDLPAVAIVRRDFDLSLHPNLSHPQNENTPHPGLVSRPVRKSLSRLAGVNSA